MSTSTKNTKTIRRGFTLIEIIVVVMIITVLATLILPKIIGRVGSAKQAAAKSKAATIAKLVNLYILDMGLSAPRDDFDLEVLLLTPDDGGGPSGPYLERADDLIDPWGNSFVIELPPGTINASFDIICWGEDGEPGGEGVNEDITQ
ncbi:MAG: type II secretion system major pseudopilin GspG [Phycisphaerales bacterium]|nr:type II secretion system major pseudopilin GspG [Planctomycetota bacterium]MBL6997134.1 type II secretion system major pseudopilin GspG [Phycisphaerales bacterium]